MELSNFIRRSGLAIMALVLSAALLPACGGDSNKEASSQPTRTADVLGVSGQSDVADPAERGPYPVGVTELVFERASTTTGQPRVLKTLVWYPAAESARNAEEHQSSKGVVDAPLAATAEPLPIILFSHGSGGIPWQSTFLTPHLASHGFVVVAPPHPGNTAADCFPCTDPAGMMDAFFNRPPDMLFVLDSMMALANDPSSMFYRALDAGRVGISGHSFGGLDTQELAANSSDRFIAALTMAPPAGDNIPAIMTDIDIPIMVMGGERDNVCPIEGQRAYFDALATDIDRFLVVFPRGGHLAYSDICIPALAGCNADDLDQEKAHRLINYYATAFLKTYVALDDGYAQYLDPAKLAGDPDVEYTAVLAP